MNKDNISNEVISLIFNIALKVRVHREWQKNNAAFPTEYSERDMLVLELVSQYPGITKKALGRILGVAPSSISGLIDRLVEEELVEKKKRNKEDGREKPLRITDKKGKAVLAKIKSSSVERYEYMFSKLSHDQIENLKPLLVEIEDAVSKRMMQDVFNR